MSEPSLNTNSYISIGLAVVVISTLLIGAKAYYTDQAKAEAARVQIGNTLDKFIALNEERGKTKEEQTRRQDAQMESLKLEVRGVSSQVTSLSSERYYRYEARELRNWLERNFPNMSVPPLSASPQ